MPTGSVPVNLDLGSGSGAACATGAGDDADVVDLISSSESESDLDTEPTDRVTCGPGPLDHHSSEHDLATSLESTCSAELSSVPAINSPFVAVGDGV